MVTRKQFDDYMMPVYNPAHFIPVKAKGSIVWDSKNKKYIDFASGIAVTSLGHCYPPLVKVLNDQSKKIWHLSNAMTNAPALNLAKTLCKHTFADKVFFANSGAEAMEGAVKTARKYANQKYGKGKNEIVAFADAFHGRTMMTIALNGSERMTKGFGPMPSGIKHHPYNEIKGLDKVITKKTAAVVLELVQGEAGIIKAKRNFISKIKKLCKEKNVLIIIDEVQSGVGRTGTLFAYEQFNIKPDILTCAKGLGNGFPIGAILTKDHIAQSMQVGAHGTTFGGNPLACSVALEVINSMAKKRLLSNVMKKEKLFIKYLNTMNKKLNCFERINTAGLWIGCKLKVTENINLDSVLQQCYKNGLMVLKANNNTIRIAPSLIIEDKLIKSGLAIIEKSIIQLQRA
ncbi:MAG: aspartate aminotransferase family protein [Gammaproteobacteria bacterium]|jgi:predicted acetylornithine/succinylornithine family transaminase|uniref:Aminotransferase class III-fold pyridoxal phosphate-dependent enzyme n=1 Tax=SAR86 cluster bacterium TaxID=2030880 RepID=A0A368C8B3_9GAMM|nr:MAG: aminotransferase class III-fold pyridoxal phosphate-dependent enzyme [SAR86 cluster bacterium]|tara:strand:- start:197 stop:1399 length:1203 start_codon:yes stop_codon:yes gene_type:complete